MNAVEAATLATPVTLKVPSAINFALELVDAADEIVPDTTAISAPAAVVDADAETDPAPSNANPPIALTLAAPLTLAVPS
jgi:hypothetical protein